MPSRGMVTGFLSNLATQLPDGPRSLHGAIVLVAMDRGLDRFIQAAMGLDCYHPGHPSPWSHCFLIAEPLNMQDPASTAILDCTIRDDDPEHNYPIKWEDSVSIIEVIRIITNHEGRVYDTAHDGVRLGDYDDSRVQPVGVKLIQGLTDDQRAAIVDGGVSVRNEGVHYDFAGLFRVLFEMLFHITPKPDESYFCSAFCQEAYRRGIGKLGDFKPGTNSHDVSPDDIWYLDVGERYPQEIGVPRLEHLRRRALHLEQARLAGRAPAGAKARLTATGATEKTAVRAMRSIRRRKPQKATTKAKKR